jgi:hypothetical protein
MNILGGGIYNKSGVKSAGMGVYPSVINTPISTREGSDDITPFQDIMHYTPNTGTTTGSHLSLSLSLENEFEMLNAQQASANLLGIPDTRIPDTRIPDTRISDIRISPPLSSPNKRKDTSGFEPRASSRVAASSKVKNHMYIYTYTHIYIYIYI